MTHVPNQQNSFQTRLYVFMFTNFVILCSNSFYIPFDRSMNLFLLFVKLRKIPIIFLQFSILIPFSKQNIASVIEEAVLQKIFPNFGTDTVGNSMPCECLNIFKLHNWFSKLLCIKIYLLKVTFSQR